MNSDYYQLTLLTMFAAVITIRYVTSLIKGVRPVLIFSRKKSFFERLAEFVPVASVGLSALLILRKVFTPHIGSLLSTGFSMPLVFQYLGITLASLSFIFLISGYWSLGNNWRVGTGDEEKKELITSGIFTFSRNPVYLFFNLFIGGLFLINGDYLLLVLSVAVLTSLHQLILIEERLLHKRFGTAYQEYTANTPRYIYNNNRKDK